MAANLLWQCAGQPQVKEALMLCLKDGHPFVREKTVRALEGVVEKGDPATMKAVEESRQLEITKEQANP